MAASQPLCDQFGDEPSETELASDVKPMCGQFGGEAFEDELQRLSDQIHSLHEKRELIKKRLDEEQTETADDIQVYNTPEDLDGVMRTVAFEMIRHLSGVEAEADSLACGGGDELWMKRNETKEKVGVG